MLGCMTELEYFFLKLQRKDNTSDNTTNNDYTLFFFCNIKIKQMQYKHLI